MSLARTIHSPWFRLSLILLLALAVRLPRVAVPNLWMDEYFSLLFSTGYGVEVNFLPKDKPADHPPDILSMRDAKPVAEVFAALRRDTHPPLPSLILRFWRQLFGDSETAARALSVLYSLLAIAFLYDTVQTLSGVGAATWAGLLMALAGPQIEFGLQIRSYIMQVAICAAGASVVARILVLGMTPRRGAALSATALAAMLTHYYSAGFLTGLFILCLIELRGRELRAAILAWIVAAVLFAVLWGPSLLAQRQNFTDNLGWIVDSSANRFAPTIGRLSSLSGLYLFESRASDALLLSGATLIPLLALVQIRRREIRFWLLPFVGMIGLVLISDLWTHHQMLTMVRYTLPASIGLYGLICVLLANRSGWLRHVLPLVACVACAAALPNVFQDRPERWNRFADEVTKLMEPGAVLVIHQEPDYRWFSVVAYSGICAYTEQVPSPAVMVDRPVHAKEFAAMAPGSSLVVVSALATDLSAVFPDHRIEKNIPEPAAGVKVSRLRLKEIDDARDSRARLIGSLYD